jgi:hypothetical protein
MARAIKDTSVFEELHNRYGTHVALRVQKELSPAEFNELALGNFTHWLEERAMNAHRAYEARLENPLHANRSDAEVGALYRRWQGAEELAFVVTVAEGAGPQRLKAVNGK